MRIADILRSALGERGAQKALAETLGINQSSVSNWVNGKSEPAPRMWPAIEQALGLEEHTLAIAYGNVAKVPDLNDITAQVAELGDLLAAIVDRLELLEERINAS